MVTHLLGNDSIAENLGDLILEKTEGVPFFIEEFVKSLRDLRIIERQDDEYVVTKDPLDIAIPSTIQDVLMARVDALPAGAKDVLQTGSVIEREFPHELIQRVTGLPEQELLSHLSTLKDAELLYERGVYPRSTYIFRHALTREVLYDSILRKKKKELHEQIGSAMEALYEKDIAEYYDTLCQHFIDGENYEKGAKYSKLAERKAEKATSFPAAIEYAKKRIDCLEKLPHTDDLVKDIIDARTNLGLYMFQMFDFIAAKEVIDPIIDLTTNMRYKKRLCHLNVILGAHRHWVEEDIFSARKQLQEAVVSADELGDMVSLFFSNTYLGFVLEDDCEYQGAIDCFEKACDINVRVNNLSGISSMKACLSTVYNLQGKVNLAYQASEEALHLAEESGDLYPRAGSHRIHGRSCLLRGCLQNAEENLLKAIDLSVRLNFSHFIASAHAFLGHTYTSMGKSQMSLEHFEKAILLRQRMGLLPSTIYALRIAMARAEVLNGERDVDVQSLYTYIAENRLKPLEGSMRRNLGEILFRLGDQRVSEAERWIEKAIESDRRNGMRWNLGMDFLLYSELLDRTGDRSRAREKIDVGIEILESCGADGYVKDAKAKRLTLE
jgi:tetratricopeptide (TPR) repeat protein